MLSSTLFLVCLATVFCMGFAGFASLEADADDRVGRKAQGKNPAFSWETFPLWLRVRKQTAYSDEELAAVAKYPVVVFEKANGYQTYGDVEAGTLAAAKGVKKLNPNTKIFFYLNAVIRYEKYRANEEFDKHVEEWALHKDGKIFMFKDKYPIFDLSHPAARNWWVKTAQGMAAHPEIDGVFIDAICKAIAPNSIYPERKYTTGYWEMATSLRKAVGPDKLLLGNAVRASCPNSNLDHLEYLDGAYVERWSIPMGGDTYEDYLAKSIEAMMKTVAQGKILLFSASYGAYGKEYMKTLNGKTREEKGEWMKEHITYPLAVFLIVAGEYSYFDWCASPDALQGILKDNDYAEYHKPLGKPLGEATRDGAIYSRQFEHVDVWVDIQSKNARLSWH